MSSSAAEIVDRLLARMAKEDPRILFKGQTIEARKLPLYESEVRRLESESANADAVARSLKGKARGMAHNQVRKINIELRKAEMKRDIANSLKHRGLTKITY